MPKTYIRLAFKLKIAINGYNLNCNNISSEKLSCTQMQFKIYNFHY